MPKTRRFNLRYAYDGTSSTASSALTTFVFRANSIFDPNVTVSGHQPMGFDQWAGLYNNYVVTGSKITVRFTQTTSQGPTRYGVVVSDTTTAPYTESTAYIEARKGTWRLSSGSTTRPVIATTTYSARKFFNVKDVRDNLDRLGAAVTADPTELAAFILWIQPVQTGVSTTYSFSVVIDYVGHFSEPVDIAQS